MERQEPTLGSDVSEVEFRRDAEYRPPRRPPPRSNDSLPWKIGVAVGAGVLVALLLFNAYERYQARRDAEGVARVFNEEMKKLERQLAASMPATPAPRPARRARTIHPLPPGYRCSGGALLHRSGSTWTQITARSNHVYCPHGGTVADCYQLTPQSVGCR